MPWHVKNAEEVAMTLGNSKRDDDIGVIETFFCGKK